MKRIILFAALAAFGSTAMRAQQPWTLERCIQHAIDNNITLKQKENLQKQNEVRLSTARNARLPDLNAGASESFSFGRSLTIDNTYANSNTTSTGFNLSTSVPLLTGNRIANNIKAARLNLQAATADLETARQDISVQVARLFVQIIYDKEMLDVANRQVSIDSMQCVRLKEMMAAGKASQAQLSQHKATMSQSQLAAVQAENTYHRDVLSLTQLLELPSPEGFTIQLPQIPYDFEATIPSPDAIYNEAVGIKPEVRAEQLRLMASDKNILIAKAALYPSLSLSAGIGTNYYKSSGRTADPFFEQMKHNFGQNIGLSLNIPIFNRLATRNNVRTARIERENQQLALDNVKKSLYKEIQQLHYNTIAAAAKCKSSMAAVESSQDAFNLMQAKYEAGKATMTEFNEAKNNLLKSQSDWVQARYQLVYQQALINFYRGKEISLAI